MGLSGVVWDWTVWRCRSLGRGLPGLRLSTHPEMSVARPVGTALGKNPAHTVEGTTSHKVTPSPGCCRKVEAGVIACNVTGKPTLQWTWSVLVEPHLFRFEPRCWFWKLQSSLVKSTPYTGEQLRPFGGKELESSELRELDVRIILEAEAVQHH